jgi:hypothetical protein
MFRTQLPRIHELRDATADPESPDAYFQNFDGYLQGSNHVKEYYGRLETALQGLDHNAWEFLKGDASPYLATRDRSGRGWQQLFDILNQAHAYNYLRAVGASKVRFIPRASRQSVKTPDLEGYLDSRTVLCEVKSLSPSQDEIRIRTEGGVSGIAIRLDDGFFRKLHSDISKAKEQLEAYDPTGEARRYVYIIPRFDDFLGRCKAQYFSQIDRYLSDFPNQGVDLIFHNEDTPFRRSLTMTAATVVNAG